MKLNSFGGGFAVASVMSILVVWVCWETGTKMLTRKITRELTAQFEEAYHHFEEVHMPKVELYEKLLAEREAEIIQAVEDVAFWKDRARAADPYHDPLMTMETALEFLEERGGVAFFKNGEVVQVDSTITLGGSE